MSHCINYCIPTRFVAKRFSLSEDRRQLARKRATLRVLQAIKKKVSPSGLILLCAMKEEPRASYDPVHRKFVSPPPPPLSPSPSSFFATDPFCYPLGLLYFQDIQRISLQLGIVTVNPNHIKYFVQFRKKFSTDAVYTIYEKIPMRRYLCNKAKK